MPGSLLPEIQRKRYRILAFFYSRGVRKAPNFSSTISYTVRIDFLSDNLEFEYMEQV